MCANAVSTVIDKALNRFCHLLCSDFTAEDVMFSYERASSEEADTSSWFSPVSEVNVVDDYTIDIMTKAPNPIFPDSIANWMMMDSGWADANNAARPDKDQGNYATINTNGTGAFVVTAREPGLRTVLEPHAGWWGEVEHNITRAELVPIQNAATALAALLSGDVDFINPVPIQDTARLIQNVNVNVIQGIEARVIMLGFPHEAETLKYSAETKDKNPFADVRVRQAVAHAVNVPAILQTIMRGNAAEVSQLVSPAMRGYSDALAARPAYDPAKAKQILADANVSLPIDVTLDVIAAAPFVDMAQSLQASFAEGGINLDIVAGTGAQVITKYRARTHEAMLLYWGPDFMDPHSNAKAFAYNADNSDDKYASTTTWRNAWMPPEDMNAKTMAALGEQDAEARLDMYLELQKETQAKAPFVIMFQAIKQVAMRDNVKGFVNGATSDYVFYRLVEK